ncbi:MAG: hypothetical protein D6708_06520 [Candidatus Dadabacteria bacterium]|nr:MAG: hypothetical protein D6708_06520 [Candidatus Dadabacteria bacterium]
MDRSYLEIRVRGEVWPAEDVIWAGDRLLGEENDLLGAVRRWGPGDPRAHLALVQAARGLAREYPEDLRPLGPGDEVAVDGEPVGPPVVLVARGGEGLAVWSRLSPAETPGALGRLERYLTRLVRLDTP